MKNLTCYFGPDSASVFETFQGTRHLPAGVILTVTRRTPVNTEFEITGAGGFVALLHAWSDVRRTLVHLGVSAEFLSLAATVALPFVAR